MPAIIFRDREARLGAFDVFDELDAPVHIVRNPDPNDTRPVHIVSLRAWPRLVRLLGRAEIAYEVVRPIASPTSSPARSGT